MCSAGHDHKQLKTSPIAVWGSLKLLGIQESEADETGPAVRLELRDCPCGSTLSRTVSP